MSWIPLGFLLVATVYDLRTREVPDWVSLLLLLWALTATGFGWHDVGWKSLGIGFAIALGLGLVLFFALDFGGADVKLLAAMGAAVGQRDLIPLFFWVAVAGGVLSLIALLRKKRDLAYVPALFLGLLIVNILRELRHARVINL